MFKLFPQIIILLALVAIIVILARRIPKLKEIQAEEKPKERAMKGFYGKFLILCQKLFTGFKNFSVNIFKKLYRKTKEIKEKKEIAPRVEKEVKELVIAAPPAEKIKVVTQDEIISLLERAAKFFGSGRFSEAEKIYIEVIKKDTKNLHAYKGLGKLYLKQGNLKDAKSSFEEVLKLKPGDSEARAEMEKIKTKMPPY